jgi:hypothetical protein
MVRPPINASIFPTAMPSRYQAPGNQMGSNSNFNVIRDISPSPAAKDKVKKPTGPPPGLGGDFAS